MEAGVNQGRHVQISFQFPARVLRYDPGLERSRVWIQGWSNIGDLAVEQFRIGIRIDLDRIAYMHIWQVTLIYVYQHPHRAGIGNREALCRAPLQQLPRS